MQDGTPLDPLYISADTSNAGTFTRPNIVPGQSISLPASQRTPEHWFNTNAFSAPAPYTFGNAGRDIIPGPGNQVIDLALHKRFSIAEKRNLEFRGEGFNVFNHPNSATPTLTRIRDRSSESTHNGPTPAIQFGARFEF